VGARNRVAGGILAAAVAAALTGCVPQSAESFNDYVDTLDAIPGVTVTYRGISTPLPFAVHGSVEVALDADADVYAALVEAACATEVNASVNLDVAVRAGESEVRAGFVDRCEPIALDLVGLALAAEGFGVGIGASRYESGVRLGVEGAGDVASTLEVLAAVAPLLPAGSWEFAARSVRLVADSDDVPGHLGDFAALAEAFPVAALDLGRNGLVVRTGGPVGADAVRALLLGRGADRYAGVAIAVTDAASGDIPPNTRPEVIELRDRLVAELGTEVRILANGVYLVAADGAEVVALSERILALDPGSTPVGIRIPGDEAAGRTELRPGSAPDLTAGPNPYPAWIEQYERVAATGLVQTVEVDAGVVEAWLSQERYDDRDAFGTVRELLDELAEEFGLERWALNNRDLTR